MKTYFISERILLCLYVNAVNDDIDSIPFVMVSGFLKVLSVTDLCIMYAKEGWAFTLTVC